MKWVPAASLEPQGQILCGFLPFSAPPSQLILPGVLRARHSISTRNTGTEHLHAHVPPPGRLGQRSQTLQGPWTSPLQMASSLHHRVSLFPPSPSASLHHWLGKDCHHLRSLWHQVTGDLLYQPSYYFLPLLQAWDWAFQGVRSLCPTANHLRAAPSHRSANSSKVAPNP